jgi:hypothetical protein
MTGGFCLVQWREIPMKKFCCLLSVSALLLVSGASLCGCNVLSAVSYKTFGPPKIPAEYVPPQTPMLVLAESYHQANDLQPYADQLTSLVHRDLQDHKVAPLVDENKLIALRAEKGRSFQQLKIPEVGKAVGARQVLYIDLQECNFAEIAASEVFQGSIRAKVRVVDVATGETKWPGVGDGKPFAAKTEFARRDARDTPLAVRNLMLEDLAAAISRQFHDVKPESDAGKGEPD